MKQTKLTMGMPVTVEIVADKPAGAIRDTFDYFRAVDKRYSTYKPNSEISRINRGLAKSDWSEEMRGVLQLCDQTRRVTHGFFNIEHNGRLDPSGLVKGWAINNAAQRLADAGYHDFYIEAGGDIQVRGHNSEGQPWRIGIRNPFNRNEIIKRLAVTFEGVATSGTYIRGQHIYNPLWSVDQATGATDSTIEAVKSLTVVGPNIYEADRFATAAFAMGPSGIAFIEARPGLEGYMVDAGGLATFTNGFERYVI